MCSRFLWRLLAEKSWHSPRPPGGRLLLPQLLGFRLVLLAASGPGVYGDEQSEFWCHTQQPGCKAACFDAFHPLSPLRFWVFQVILVAVPSVLYMGFTLYHVIWHWELSGKGKEEEDTLIQGGESSRDTPGAGSLTLLWAYVAQLGAQLVLEGTAPGLQYHLYGFQMPSSFACGQEPCPYRLTCTFSRPSEKIIFLKAIFRVSGFRLLFTLLEIVLLGLGRLCKPLQNFLGGASSSSHALALSSKRNLQQTLVHALEGGGLPVKGTTEMLDLRSPREGALAADASRTSGLCGLLGRRSAAAAHFRPTPLSSKSMPLAVVAPFENGLAASKMYYGNLDIYELPCHGKGSNSSSESSCQALPRVEQVADSSFPWILTKSHPLRMQAVFA
ncbi:gap junction gamma-3 protein-like [Theropithecus gelada]|uniref:gap junction gamma-3 protein-like n=1 Tax=Theropithecus gelada TaxID=9565 RepID=UPI000DC1B8D1|nr:gap junction gamma-3 protein-like [Theropithecus gelada]